MANIEWNSKFTTSDRTVSDGLTHMLLKGVLIDTSSNKNNWQVEESDFKQLATDFIGKQLRCDHGDHVDKILGRVISTEVDSGHSEAKTEWDPSNINPHIHYTAEIASKDDSLIIPIAMGFVDYVSPAVDATQILCSVCRTPMRDKQTKNCDCTDSVLLLKNLQARELSLVASPAYDKTVAKVYSFAASVDKLFSSTTISSNDKIEIKNLNIGKTMAENDRIVRLEASVSALIAAFKAAQEEEEEEKKAEMKAEEEQKLVAEEEEEKMVPVSQVAEEEEASPEDKKEEEAEKKIEKLEASIRRLASLMQASKITPETPEDEPADSTHKVPKITNEPVKSERLKDGFKFPLETGGMKPGKIKASAGRTQGQSTSFTGAVAKDSQDNEQKAVDEIFGFAASRGTIPMNADSRIRTIRYK